MPGGRPRLPTRLKLIKGTAQPCRLTPNEAQGTLGTPQPPAWLSPRGVEYFFATCADMSRMGTLSVEWAGAIADYAFACDEFETCNGIVEDLGRTYKTKTAAGETMFRPRPEVAMRDECVRRKHLCRTALGLDPSASSRVSASKKSANNPFAEFL